MDGTSLSVGGHIEMGDALERRVAAVVANDLAIDEPPLHFNMVEAGLIDSLALVGLVARLQDALGCQIPPDRVNGDTFATVGTITAMLTEIDSPAPTPSAAPTVRSSSYLHRLLLAAIAHPVVPVRWRARLLRRAGLVIGKRVEMYSGAHIGSTGLRIGDGVFINHGLFYDGVAAVTVGNAVSFGPHVRLVTAAHRVGPPDRRCDRTPMPFPIVIGDGCWLATAVTVLPGVTIAPGCVIANGAVVSEDTAPDGHYAGVPARRTRDLRPSDVVVVPQQRANSA